MSELASRAEAIGAHLVAHALGATASKFDAEGRQSAVDFLMEWPNGRHGALEVTLVTQPESAAWQGMAAREGWQWPALSGWEFRLAGPDMPYRRARNAVLRAVALCDQWGVDEPHGLPADVLDREPEVGWVNEVGELRRSSLKPGVSLFSEVRAEFVEASTCDFATVVEGWLKLPHMPRHVEKVLSAAGVAERHLFLVPVDEVLPARFLTNDFAAPTRSPEGFSGLDGIWIWSNYWHQFLVCRGGSWQWLDFPPKGDRRG
ncbi:hypothetical protein GCM10009740_10900 [Terrabacter terrae]|uniref:Uncharacterized protein n=1 Tax=Terrabacter terrae TaxID=318434 RepID=A0ABP5FFJ1_9MICO